MSLKKNDIGYLYLWLIWFLLVHCKKALMLGCGPNIFCLVSGISPGKAVKQLCTGWSFSKIYKVLYHFVGFILGFWKQLYDEFKESIIESIYKWRDIICLYYILYYLVKLSGLLICSAEVSWLSWFYLGTWLFGLSQHQLKLELKLGLALNWDYMRPC